MFTVGPNGEASLYKGRVRIGKHTFVAEKPGYNAQVDAPFIGPGENFRIELKLYTAEELTRYRRKWDGPGCRTPWSAAARSSAWSAPCSQLSAGSTYDEFDTEVARCNEESGNGGVHRRERASSLRDSGDTKRTLGYVGYGVAGAAVVTGAVLAVPQPQRALPDHRRRVQGRSCASRRQVSVTPLVAPGMAWRDGLRNVLGAR